MRGSAHRAPVVTVRNTRIIDPSTGSLSAPCDIHCESGEIREITPRRHEVSPEDLDAGGCYAIPGLVNAHAHTAMTLLRGSAEDLSPESWFNDHIWMYEKNLTPRDVYVGTLLGAAEMLLNGVTWVADHYFHMDQAFRAYEKAGMRATICEAMFGTGEEDDRTLGISREFVEEYRGKNRRIDLCLGPHSPYLCSDAFLGKTVKLSETLGVPVHIHVSEVAGQLEKSLADRKLTPVEVLEQTGVLREGTILAHAYYATDEDLANIRKNRCGVAHCAKTYMKFADSRDFLPRALDAGVLVGLGTDGPASNNTLDIFETARCAALLAKTASGDPAAAPVDAVLPLLFSGGRVLGNAAYGTLVPGAPADIVLISPSRPNLVPSANITAHLIYSMTPYCVDSVIVDGETVVRRGKLLTLDMGALIEEAESIYPRLISTDGGEPMQRYDT